MQTFGEYRIMSECLYCNEIGVTGDMEWCQDCDGYYHEYCRREDECKPKEVALAR